MTLTLKGVIALILRYFTEFDSFVGRLRHRFTVVEDRPITSAEYSLPPLANTDHSAARFPCDSWASCLFYR